MTRLFNLESYVECCHHALLFHQQPEQLIPQNRDLPTAYKGLLQKYASYPYLPELISDSNCPQELVINPAPLNYLLIGDELNQEDTQQLFIIRDTVDLMTLSTSNLLERRDGYLYSSAYHYWNHYSEISQHNLTKPLVFIDLDSFGCDRLIPINFAITDNSQYKVPILDTREKEPIVIDSKYNFTETSNNIYKSITLWILNEHFPAIAQNFDTVTTLAKYLQKVSLFQNIQQYINQNKVFYKQVSLSISTIAEIVAKGINTQYLKQLASTYPQHQFALISQYNIFPKIQGLLPEFICLSPINQEFTKIWQEKSQMKFPLFGIYLDTIEFAIKMLDRTKQWIQLSNQEDAISYEGKTTILRGHILSINQDFFRIPSGKTAKLPIKVNGKDYCKNNILQDYSIKTDNSQGTENVCIRIEFQLQPGAFPELRVTDLEGKYKITAYLTDRENSSYSHIPIDKITSNRKQESSNQINRLEIRQELEHLREYLLQISRELDKLDNTGNRVRDYTRLIDLIKGAYQQIHKNSRKLDLLQFVDASSNEPIVSSLRTELQNKSIHRLTEIISGFLNSNSRSVLNLVQKDLLVEAIMFIGKTYKFSQYLLPANLFSQSKAVRAGQIRNCNLGNEYLQCLARIAVDEKLQKEYFSWFNSYFKLETNKYLWGYGRILLWYYNFNSPVNFLNYRVHFTAIMQYLLSKSPVNFNKEYKQNAFLALLYLLTLRATDKSFCQHGSSEMQMAETVIAHFSNDTIPFNQVSREKPLNQFFREMIEGTATDDDLDNLVGV